MLSRNHLVLQRDLDHLEFSLSIVHDNLKLCKLLTYLII